MKCHVIVGACSESHYTEDWTLGFDEYVQTIFCTDIRDFISDYYENKPLPDFTEV